MMPRSKTSVLIPPVLILLLFAPALIGVDRLAFRDVSHFYTPLYDYVAERCDESWLPLWNPLDQTGVPLIGETTPAVLYPVRGLVYSLPLSGETAIAWYVVLHLILASLTARLLARWVGCRNLAATIAGTVYPLSGVVLFLYTNPPFLVGAAWMPLTMGALIAPLVGSQRIRILLGGVAMAMMILGGDPQSALHSMIMAGGVWMVCMVRRNTMGPQLSVLLGVPVLAAILAAPQLAASAAWSLQSERLQDRQAEHWVQPPIVGSQRHQTFQFSLPPWHLAELTTPNAFGSFLPINRRISRLLPGDGRSWTPTIYMGMIAMLALLIRLRHRCPGPWFAIFLVAIGLSFGHFGLAWCLQTCTGAFDRVDSAIGGPYWWLYQFFPGYDSFRYPAKWLTVASLAGAILTAQIVDQPRNQDLLERLSLRISIILAVALGLLQALRWYPQGGPQQRGLLVDEFWGPFQMSGAIQEISRSLTHSLAILLSIGFMIRFSHSRDWSRGRWQLALLTLIALDLTISSYGLIYRVPKQGERLAIEAIGGPIQGRNESWMRTQSESAWPNVWRGESDAGRLLDVESSTRAAWFGRWHLASRAKVLNNMVSIRSEAFARFWQAARLCMRDMTLAQQDRFWDSVRRWLAIEGVMHTSGQVKWFKTDERTASLVDRQIQRKIGLPNLHAYRDWKHQPAPVTTKSLAKRLQRLGDPKEFDPQTQRPLVESKSPLATPEPAENLNFEHQMISQTPESAEYRVSINHLALITRPVFQDGCWIGCYSQHQDGKKSSANSPWQKADVFPVDGITQGIVLPAGDWNIRFEYSPTWLNWAIGVACIGWITFLALIARWRKEFVATFLLAPNPIVAASWQAPPMH